MLLNIYYTLAVLNQIIAETVDKFYVKLWILKVTSGVSHKLPPSWRALLIGKATLLHGGDTTSIRAPTKLRPTTTPPPKKAVSDQRTLGVDTSDGTLGRWLATEFCIFRATGLKT